MKRLDLVKLTTSSIALMLTMGITVFAGEWKHDSVGWWFSNGSNSYPASQWMWIDGNNDGTAECYYFNQAGYLLVNTTTPDGYMVNDDGAWIVGGLIQTKQTGNSNPSSIKTSNSNISKSNKSKTKKKDNESNINTYIPEDAVEYNGHYYYVYDAGTTSSYEKALEYCEDRGGYLATITSKAENDFLFNYITEQGLENAYFGLSDAEEEGNWKWCTDEEVVFTNWAYGEPNAENIKEDYAMFYFKYNDGTWNDEDFNRNGLRYNENAFIFEWGD